MTAMVIADISELKKTYRDPIECIILIFTICIAALPAWPFAVYLFLKDPNAGVINE